MILNIQSEKEKNQLYSIMFENGEISREKMRERQNGVDSYFFANSPQVRQNLS